MATAVKYPTNIDQSGTGRMMDEVEVAAEEIEPTNIRTLRVRAWTAQDNAYYDDLLSVVSPTAYVCLAYLIRQTVGYHQRTLRASYKQIGDAVNLTRNTAMKALAELEKASIVGAVEESHGRTQVHTFELLPIEGWTLEAIHPTSVKNALVDDDPASANIELDDTSVNNALVASNFALVGDQTSAKFGHANNKETSRKETIKETDEALASSSADASNVTPPKKRTRPPRARKLTDEQLAIHRHEQERAARLMKAFAEALHVAELPHAGREKPAALWFSRELEGVEDWIQKVLNCYRLCQKSPYRRMKGSTLYGLQDLFPAYRQDPKQFAADCQSAADTEKNNHSRGSGPRAPAEPVRYVAKATDPHQTPISPRI